MKIVTDHPECPPGRPIFLDAEGAPLEDHLGLQAARKRLGLNAAQLGHRVGRSARTVENYEQGRHRIPAEVLYVLMRLLG